MSITQEEAAKLLFMSVEAVKKKEKLRNDDPKLKAIMRYQEIMTQPTVDKAAVVLRRKYKQVHVGEIRGDNWE